MLKSLEKRDFSEKFQKAYDEELSLLEICTGDYENPLYVSVTPNVDMAYLKEKWCSDYCAFHDLVIVNSTDRENADRSVAADAPKEGESYL